MKNRLNSIISLIQNITQDKQIVEHENNQQKLNIPLSTSDTYTDR